MSSQTDKSFKYFPLTGDALELLAAFRSEMSAGEEEQFALREELTKRSETMLMARNAALRELWTRMAASVGIGSEAFDNPNYGIEARYLDEGFGALTYKQMPTHPLAELMGEVAPEDDSPEAVPDKSKLH